jgi:hypothetical protein
MQKLIYFAFVSLCFSLRQSKIIFRIIEKLISSYTVKKDYRFSHPYRDVTDRTLSGHGIIPRQGELG